jgi:hypothetical protein
MNPGAPVSHLYKHTGNPFRPAPLTQGGMHSPCRIVNEWLCAI